MSFAAIAFLSILLVLILLLLKVTAAAKSLSRINDNLRIVCAVLQETPEERSEREAGDWMYAHNPNLIQQKRSVNGVPFDKP